MLKHYSSATDCISKSEMATGEKSVMVVAIDDSEHSVYALEWTLDHFFTPSPTNSPFKLVIVHARSTASSVIGAAAAASGVIPIVELDLKTIAARLVEKAMEICVAKSVNDACFEVHEGDARNVLCEVVERYHASILVVGSHGYGAIKRAALGKVSDYCAHHVNCTVMIVKKPIEA